MGEVKRQPVDYRWDGINWDFIKGFAKIANYAGQKYGSPEQYTGGRLEGEKSPINHIYEHLRQYQAGEKHDHFGSLEAQLWAIGYNAMMEFFYLTHGGPTSIDVFYKKEEPVHAPMENTVHQVPSIVIPIDAPQSVHNSLLNKFFGGLNGGKSKGLVQ
jgi:hypothetical protein